MRELNEITVKNAYPLSRIDQTLDAIGNVEFLPFLTQLEVIFKSN